MTKKTGQRPSLTRRVRAQLRIHEDGTASFLVRGYDFRWADMPIAVNGYLFAPVRSNDQDMPLRTAHRALSVGMYLIGFRMASLKLFILSDLRCAVSIKEAIRWPGSSPRPFISNSSMNARCEMTRRP